jgi:hypothetical protein
MKQCVLAMGLSSLLSRGETNATTFRRGDRAISPSSGPAPTWWDYRSGVERTALSWGVVLGTIALLWLSAHGYGHLIRSGALSTTAAVLGALGWRATGTLVHWRHNHEVVLPLARGVARYVDRHDGERNRFVTVPREWVDPESPPIRIELPHHLMRTESTTGNPMARRYNIEALCAAKLRTEVAVTWNDHGWRPHLLVRPKHLPPDGVGWADMEPLYREAPEHVFHLGLGANRQPHPIDLREDSAHVLLAAASGGGKTVLACTLLAQAIARGASVTILNAKRKGYRWAHGLPGVREVRDIGDINDELVALHHECERRIRLDEAHEDDPEPYTFPRHIILMEEMNATGPRLKRWWKAQGGKGPVPGIEALSDILFVARGVGMNVFLLSQSATVQALGGDPALREQFAGAKALARFSQNQARMLVPEVSPLPVSGRHLGRFVLVTGGEANIIQAAYLSDEELRAYAAEGATDTQTAEMLVREAETEAHIASPVLTLPEVHHRPPVERYTLGQLSEDHGVGILPMKYDNLRKERRRAEVAGRLFIANPEGDPATYTADDARWWARNRVHEARAVVS